MAAITSFPALEPEPKDSVRELSDYLRATGKVGEAALERAHRLAEETGARLEDVLTSLGLLSERERTESIADFLGLTIAKERDYPSAPVFGDRFSAGFLKSAQIIPLGEHQDGIAVATPNPLDTQALNAVRFALGKPVLPLVAYPSEFEAAYERLYGKGHAALRAISAGADTSTTATDDVDLLKDIASEAPVIRLVNFLISKAVEARASDIHIEPMESDLRIRYRVDGILQSVESPPQRLSAAIISRVKIMAKLNIAERRLSQDGRIRLAVRGKDVDFRVSTTPTIHGESVVLRILDRGQLKLDFSALGFEEDVANRFRNMLNHPHGIVLVTGPTGSGKTTTLYTGLLELNTPDRKILTIEDPVEYQLPGINQVQVKAQIGLTFASALRSFLRQDPDIMMVGEIRDLETAQIAVQAALTGHLVLSTLHTNDAASAVTRLLDMGVEDYLLTSTLNGVAAQRLVRTLCLECREPYEPLPEFLERFVEVPVHSRAALLYRPKGCAACQHTGYFGRSSLVETLQVSEAIRQAILKRSDATRIHQIAVDEGMQTMQVHGLKKAFEGVTTIEEVLRVTRAA